MTSGYIDNSLMKYDAYHDRGHLVLAVTMSTFITNEKFAKSGAMSYFWERDFMNRVHRQVPKSLWNQIDYDYVIEGSLPGPKDRPEASVAASKFRERNWHIHGLLAFTPDAGRKVWQGGALNKHLARDLNSFRTGPRLSRDARATLSGGLPANAYFAKKLRNLRQTGAYRQFSVNSWLIEPVRQGSSPAAWITYYTKTPDFVSWTCN
jgi:hypothetical protein